MHEPELSKPFLETWLKRMRKEMARSGRLSEIALILSRLPDETFDLDQAGWREMLLGILGEEVEPCFEILTKIDRVLAHPGEKSAEPEVEEDLFGWGETGL